MTERAFTLAATSLVACASGALWWPAEAVLVVADLHLGKAERVARRGGALLPPYETAATLDRLADEIGRRAPATVVCLGDSFDDLACADALAPADVGRLAVLTAGRDWIWVAGNHDPAPLAVPGRHLAEMRLGGLVFRHAARPGLQLGEVSGHYHPKVRLPVAGGVARAAFVHDGLRLMLPAFGAYTGGLWADHPAVRGLFGAQAWAILTGSPCVAVPLDGCARRRAG